MSIRGLQLAGWKFTYQGGRIRFVEASHPLGGKFSVVRIEDVTRNGFDPDEFGKAIEAMLNDPEIQV